jgi:hypothetical protein
MPLTTSLVRRADHVPDSYAGRYPGVRTYVRLCSDCPAAPKGDTNVRYAADPGAGRHSVISGLRDSMTYKLAVHVYQGHHDPGSGVCVRCGHSAPCPPRGRAAAVIVAAGDDPRQYDAQPPGGPYRYASATPAHRPQLRRRVPMVDGLRPTGYGYPLGGRHQARGRYAVIER